jgi:hypothetical protein
MCDVCRPPSQNTEGEGIAQAARVPLREQLEKIANHADTNRRQAHRALDILERHPEFEEFLELKELLDGRIY